MCRQGRVELSRATATSLGTQRVMATKFLCAYCTCVFAGTRPVDGLRLLYGVVYTQEDGQGEARRPQ